MKESENIRAITNFLFIEDDIDDLKKSDLVIILCNNNINGIVSVFDRLYKNNIIDNGSLVVISGDRGPLDDFEGKECEAVFNKLVNEYGYDSKMFALEKNATNIYENLKYSKEIIEDFDKYNNTIIIGAAFALRRIKLCASGMNYPLEKVQFVGTVNIEKRPISIDNWWQDDIARIRVYEELERIGKYLIKGDLDIK
jgi:hypothetical protein